MIELNEAQVDKIAKAYGVAAHWAVNADNSAEANAFAYIQELLMAAVQREEPSTLTPVSEIDKSPLDESLEDEADKEDPLYQEGWDDEDEYRHEER